MASRAKPLQSSKSNDIRESLRSETLRLFSIENIQHLSPGDAAKCQSLLGHGDVLGEWKTPREWVSSASITRIDFKMRILRHLPQEYLDSLERESAENLKEGIHSSLLERGVLAMTRYALLCRLGPSKQRLGKSRPLDTNTIASKLYNYVPQLTALAIQSAIDSHDRDSSPAFFYRRVIIEGAESISPAHKHHLTNEVLRMQMWSDMGLWNDAPTRAHVLKEITDVKGEKAAPAQEQKPNQWQPLPDDYVAEMGQRVLWISRELGPNYLHLLEFMIESFRHIPEGASESKLSKLRQKCINLYFEKFSWNDHLGRPITKPPFDFIITEIETKGAPQSEQSWPPKRWKEVRALSTILQSAHIWILALSTGGRVGELRSFKRDSLNSSTQSAATISGRTYKLVDSLDGSERTWVLSDAAHKAILQQQRLAAAWEKIDQFYRSIKKNETVEFDHSDQLWISMGNGQADSKKRLEGFSFVLQRLALSVGMNPTPGGINLHPHRFRKTIARICALALTNSPRILMQVFGHKDIDMTLYYILTDKGIAAETETVAREIRVMRCQEIIEEIRDSDAHDGRLIFGGYGGGGAASIDAAVRAHEAGLHRSGRQWDASSAHELSLILTMNGQSGILVKPHVICMKTEGQPGACIRNNGHPNAANCQTDCINRIEDKTARRDVEEIIPSLIDSYMMARKENQLLLMADIRKQLKDNLMKFDDIREKWSLDPMVRMIVGETTP